MNRLIIGKRLTPPLLLGVISAFSVGCDGHEHNAHDASIVQLIETEEQASARLRTLYFKQDERTASLEGERLLLRFPNSPELIAWHALNLSKVGEQKRATSYSTGLLESAPNDPWSKFAF